MNTKSLSVYDWVVFVILFIWTLAWKGLAFWRAAKDNQIKWFILFLLLLPVNLLGIPEITYLFFFARKKMTFDEIKNRFNKTLSKLTGPKK